MTTNEKYRDNLTAYLLEVATGSGYLKGTLLNTPDLDDAWHILCKKSKTNTNKDDPKSMEIVVAKGTCYPISLSTKMEGLKLTMKDLSFGVTENQVTFDPKKYASAKVVDKRNK